MPVLSRRFWLVLAFTTFASGLLWVVAKSTLKKTHIDPYARQGMGSCPLPVGDRRGVWSIAKASGGTPFVGLDARLRYKDATGQMHAGDIDEVMTIFSRANGFWGLKYLR